MAYRMDNERASLLTRRIHALLNEHGVECDLFPDYDGTPNLTIPLHDEEVVVVLAVGEESPMYETDEDFMPHPPEIQDWIDTVTAIDDQVVAADRAQRN